MKLFITGGAGFIGSNFVRYWMNTHPDDDVIVYDSKAYICGAGIWIF
jgi:dTDP-glucose 4,6-dehydratase